MGLDGELSVIWENYVLGKIMGRRSDDSGASFGPEFEVSPIRDNVALEPTSWFTNYSRSNPLFTFATTMTAPAAFSVTVDRSEGPRRGTWYLVTAEHAVGTIGPLTGVRGEIEPNRFYASATEVAIGEDIFGGVVGTESSTDFDLFAFDGEAGQTFWLSGRYTANPQALIHTFGVACATDTTSVTFVGSVGTKPDGSAPPALFTLPSTGRYNVFAGSSINVSINYILSLREFIVDPSSAARDHRDILLCSSTDGGVTWSPKVRVNDGPVGGDESFPEVVVDGSGRVHVAWYDRRDAPGCGSQIHTYWTWSDDGGQTFQPSRRVSEIPSHAGAGIQRWQAGDHLGLAAEGEDVYVMWYRNEPGGSGDIWGSVITDLPTPVLVSGLVADDAGEGVRLSWYARDVHEVREFRVHRATETSEYDIVGAIAARYDGGYEWQDASAAPGVRYRYRLEVARTDGASLWVGPIVFTLPMPAVRLVWRGAAPNPFAETVEMELETPDRGQTRVTVYDVTGHEVADLTPESSGDRTSVRWNGRDGRGRLVAPGVYLVRAQLGAQNVVRQVVRMR